MSPKTNRRTDVYSCNASNTLRFLHRIVTSIRKVVPADFILGVKVNASDYVDISTDLVHPASAPDDNQKIHQRIETQKIEQESRALEHVRIMASWHMIDFIEISGGDYETPEFMSPNPLSKSPRQAFFAQFSHRAMEALTLSPKTILKTSPLILLTGGLRTPSHLETAIISRHADLLGIGRGSVTCPNLPDVLRQMENTAGKQAGDAYTLFAPEPNLALGFFGSDWIGSWMWTFMSRIQLIGAGASMAWYIVMIRRLASRGDRTVQMDYDMGAVGAIFKMWITTEETCLTAFAAAIFAMLLAGMWHCIQCSQ